MLASFSCLVLVQMLIHELQSSRWWNEHSKENICIINIYELLWDWIETRETSNLSFFYIIYLPNINYIKHTMTYTETVKTYKLSWIWIIEIRLFNNPIYCTPCLHQHAMHVFALCVYTQKVKNEYFGLWWVVSKSYWSIFTFWKHFSIVI